MVLLSDSFAVARREFLSGIRYKGWWVRWTITPLLALARFLFLGVSIAQQGNSETFAQLAGTSNYLAFLTVGLVLDIWAESVLWGPGWTLYYEQKAGTLLGSWTTPTNPSSIIIGTSLYDLIENLVMVLLLTVVSMMLFGFKLNVNLLSLVTAILATVLGLYGFGLIFAALVVSTKDANSITGLFGTLFLVLSGTTYPITALPVWIRSITWLSPLTWGIDACRKAVISGQVWFGTSNGWWLIAYSVALPLIGFGLFLRCIHRAKRTGSLALF